MGIGKINGRIDFQSKLDLTAVVIKHNSDKIIRYPKCIWDIMHV